MESLPNPRRDLAGAGTAVRRWFNVTDIRSSLEEVLEFIHRSRLPLLDLGETQPLPAGPLKHPATVTDHRHPREEFSKGL